MNMLGGGRRSSGVAVPAATSKFGPSVQSPLARFCLDIRPLSSLDGCKYAYCNETFRPRWKSVIRHSLSQRQRYAVLAGSFSTGEIVGDTVEERKERCKAWRLANPEREKAYRLANREHKLAYQKEWRFAKREQRKVSNKAYRIAHREERRAYQKKWYEANTDRRTSRYKVTSENRKAWREANREHVNAMRRIYGKRRRAIDLEYKILCNLRTRIHKAIRRGGATKSVRTLELIGCSVQHLRDHLESQFTEGMTWDNHGAWHMDHIKPCCSFDMTVLEQQKKCFNYTNLQPLWAFDNMSKGGRT